jgi:acetyltransferase-like isoleucine patch superfamily enzyme
VTNLTWILSERNSPSDLQVQINEVFYTNGSEVTEGTPLFELEGAKAVYVIEAPCSGFFYALLPVDSHVNVGDYIGCISDQVLSAPIVPPKILESNHSADEKLSDVVPITGEVIAVSEGARKLAKQLGVELGAMSELGFITTEMVQAHHDRINTTSSEDASDQEGLHSKRIAIIGGSQQCSLAWHGLSTSTERKIVGVFDNANKNSLARFGVPFFGKATVGAISRAYREGKFDSLFVGIGGANMEARKYFMDLAKELSIPLATIIDPAAIVSPSARVGQGSLIMDSARVGPFARLGDNVFLSAGVNIEHHCSVGDGTTFGPAVTLSGRVSIGSFCRLAALIAFEPDSSLGDWCVVASGSIVTSIVPDNSAVKAVVQQKISPIHRR